MSDIHLPAINGHNSWSALQEVWLGDVYPADWYDHLDAEVRDVFYQLTEITKQDLSIIQSTLELFGVRVRRPKYHDIEHFLIDGQLIKPEICPRDHCVVIGNTLYMHDGHHKPWQHAIDDYTMDPRCHVVRNSNPYINGANVVRIGKDIIIDRADNEFHDWQTFPEHRVHVVSNGGHMDGCLAVLRPGLLLANTYFDQLEKSFPGWTVIQLNDPRYWKSVKPVQTAALGNHKFWDTGVGSNRSFNQHVIDHALDWVGFYTETYFELNCLVVDPDNVIMLYKNDALAEDLYKHGIKVHWVPFRARNFWDGAMHCLTLDIRRQSTIEDFWPDRANMRG